MSNKYVMVLRIQKPGNCQARMIVDTFSDIRGFPDQVTDDAGNTYTLHKQMPEYHCWYTVEDKPPTRITMGWSWHGPRSNDTRPV